MNEPLAIQLDEAEYLAWEARQPTKAELHHGFVVASAGGTLEHNLLALRMRDVLTAIFPAPCLTLTSDVKVKITSAMFFYPDVTVVCEAVDPKSVYVERPRIVVEVLSPATRAYDIVEKRAAYRSLPSLEAYVIVHSDIRRIEVDSLALDRSWQTVTYENFDSLLLGGSVVPVAEIYGALVSQ